ncbi:hypothetical protein [Actinoalloteichus hymeniacidonis]|uniref:Uncharacterized protein n=1 Tax=Actinoalloteichus hymeniacidonis TaxID=340345 RepID=A0AAC9HUL7_9PSEU|nr:hypothetical protein [Actinoalloteichus hymeniacidonis]AOS65256.1 hypothetical protein TL08_22370 [Actinoalloteichus hymeniacidonis]MBB5906662.1 hypothetical protein [Actinoalloteichus hymeniacidonis]
MTNAQPSNPLAESLTWAMRSDGLTNTAAAQADLPAGRSLRSAGSVDPVYSY